MTPQEALTAKERALRKAIITYLQGGGYSDERTKRAYAALKALGYVIVDAETAAVGELMALDPGRFGWDAKLPAKRWWLVEQPDQNGRERYRWYETPSKLLAAVKARLNDAKPD